jgi:hypothetical protein
MRTGNRGRRDCLGGAFLGLLAVIACGCAEPRPGEDPEGGVDARRDASGVDVRADVPADAASGGGFTPDVGGSSPDASFSPDAMTADGPAVMVDAPVAAVCSPGEPATCTGSMLRKCRGDGSGYDTTGCASGCRSDRPECLVCSGSEHACDGQCRSNTSPDSCGTRCTPCALVTNAMPTCESAACSFSCHPDSIRCNAGKDACERIAWSFEQTVEGWMSNSATDRADNGMVVSSADRAHLGSASLKAILMVDGPRPAFRLAYWPCGRSPYTRDGPEALNVRNKSIRFWVYIDSANAPTTGHECGAGGYGGPLPFGYNEARTPIPPNTWTMVVSRYPEEPASASTFLGIDCRFNPVPNWAGAIYIDQVRIE